MHHVMNAMPLNCTLEMIKMIKFILYVTYHNVEPSKTKMAQAARASGGAQCSKEGQLRSWGTCVSSLQVPP